MWRAVPPSMFHVAVLMIWTPVWSSCWLAERGCGKWFVVKRDWKGVKKFLETGKGTAPARRSWISMGLGRGAGLENGELWEVQIAERGNACCDLSNSCATLRLGWRGEPHVSRHVRDAHFGSH